MDAVTRIMKDHRELEELFKRVTSREPGRQETFERVCAMLLAHGHAEEQEVYPEIAKLSGQDRAEVQHGTEEHHEAERLVEQLQEMGVEADGFDALFGKLVESVQHHVAEEESELLPRLKEGVDQQRLDKLGEAFATHRDAELGRGNQRR